MLESSWSEEFNISMHYWRSHKQRGPAWQLLTPPPNPSAQHKGAFLTPCTRQFRKGKVHTCILLSILNPLGFSPGEFWQRMLDFRGNRISFCQGGGAGVLHCLDRQQVLTVAFLSYLWCDMASSDSALTGRHDGRQRTATPACVVLRYSKKLVWILQEGLWCGDPRLQVLPASCFPLCMTHLWYFWNISSVSFIHIFLQLSTYTPVPLQKNMAHEIPLRETCLGLDWGGKCQKHCQRYLIFPRRLAVNI